MLRLSLEVVGRLEEHKLFQDARRVLLFSSLPDEVNTHDLIGRYYKDKQILLPTVIGDDMELHLYNGVAEQGAYGIDEAVGPLVTNYDTIDLAVIPGVAFDRRGNRLGRGKGYYDKFLPQLRCHTIGLCFPFQLINEIPTEPHDIKVNEVIA